MCCCEFEMALLSLKSNVKTAKLGEFAKDKSCSSAGLKQTEIQVRLKHSLILEAKQAELGEVQQVYLEYKMQTEAEGLQNITSSDVPIVSYFGEQVT